MYRKYLVSKKYSCNLGKKECNEWIKTQRFSIHWQQERGDTIGKILIIKQEIPLTTKEFELLCLLATNQGQVLTYTQIYEKVWGSTPAGNERVIRFHLCNLRKKLNAISQDDLFVIRCIRDVGYCFEVISK